MEEEEPGFAVSASVSRAFDELVISPLKELQPGDAVKPLVVVLDALDECGKPGSPERVALLRTLGTVAYPNGVKFLVTSRPESDIRDELERFRPYTMELTEEVTGWGRGIKLWVKCT